MMSEKSQHTKFIKSTGYKPSISLVPDLKKFTRRAGWPCRLPAESRVKLETFTQSSLSARATVHVVCVSAELRQKSF